jgi:hypothetical protein
MGLALPVFLFLGAAIPLALPQGTSSPVLSEASVHSFRLVLKYFYTIQEYTPPVPLAEVKPETEKAQSPESALASLMLALASREYPQWLSMWDKRSQRKIEAERIAAKISQAELIGNEAMRLDRGVHILSFVSRGVYVILRFTRDRLRVDAIAFKRGPSGWVATREIDNELEAIAGAKYDVGGTVAR